MQKFFDFVNEYEHIRYDRRLERTLASGEKIVLSYPLLKADAIAEDVRCLRYSGADISYITIPQVSIGGWGQGAVFPREISGIPYLPLLDIEVARDAGIRTVYHHAVGTWIPYSEYFGRHGMEMIAYQSESDLAKYREDVEAIVRHLPELKAIYAKLSDDRSREVFLAALRAMFSKSYAHYEHEDAKQYFLEGYLPQAGDIVIDGGAYDGRTAMDFAGLAAKVHSFELDRDNYLQALKITAHDERVTMVNMGLGDKRGRLSYVPASMSSRIAEGTGAVVADIIDIDSYMSEQNLGRLDFLKLDVEGAESQAITGGSETIAKHKPKLAICMYHKVEDMWELPQLVHSIRPDYELAFRHYPVDGRFEYLSPIAMAIRDHLNLDYNVKAPAETILYAR